MRMDTISVSHGSRRRLQKRREWPFWPVYADVMVSLFAVTLTLFALSYWWLNGTFRVPAAMRTQLQAIDEAIRGLADGVYFEYQPEFKRHVLRQGANFERGSAIIPPKDVPSLLDAGRRIQALLNDLKNQHPKNIRFLVVIEGMASNDGYRRNYELSYERALALYRLWREAGIVIENEICEVAITGSGTGGIGRYGANEEARNQRFLIQILPRVGTEGWSVAPQ